MISKLKIMSLFFLTCGLVTAINPCVGMDSNTHFGSNSNNTNNIKDTNCQNVPFNNSEQYEMLNNKYLSEVNNNITKNNFNYNNKNNCNYNNKNKFNINNKPTPLGLNNVNVYGSAPAYNDNFSKYSGYNKYNPQNYNNINYNNNINNKINNEEMNNYNNINNKINNERMNNKDITFFNLSGRNNEITKDFKSLKDRSLEMEYINENRINHLQSLTGAQKQRYAMNLARNAFFANPDNKNAALRGYRGTTAVGRSTPGASNTHFMEGSRNNNNDSQHKNTKESPK